ncbi:MAG TPA: hypothetical protein VJ023_06010 [Pyrinomonadaceae bacterium]|nr:hypothetical protein [Pyrinomonadaceae bacterium]
MKNETNNETDKKAAVGLAKEHAERTHGSLDGYNIVPCEQDGFWRVFLEPKNTSVSQKGVEYVIGKQIRRIVSQRELPLATAGGSKENASSKSDINKEDAVAIAKKDGVAAYGSLVSYDLIACDLAKVWIVIFSPKESMDGGGPEYVIDKGTGKILDKRYYQ